MPAKSSVYSRNSEAFDTSTSPFSNYMQEYDIVCYQYCIEHHTLLN